MQPSEAAVAGCAALFALALCWWRTYLAVIPAGWWGTWLLAGLLVLAVVGAYQFPLQVSPKSKIYLSSTAYYLLAVLLVPPLAATGAVIGSLVGEISVQKRRGTLLPDIVVQTSRRSLVVLAACAVAHLPGHGAVYSVLLILTALVLWVGDIVTFPLLVRRLVGQPPVRIVVSAARQSYLLEGAQYLLGLIGGLIGAHNFSTVAFLAPAMVLVYLAFRAKGEAEEARAAAESAAEALRESEARYRTLFENASDIVYTHDLTGNFTSINRAGADLLGYESSELLTMNIADLVPPDKLQGIQSVLDSLQHGTPGSGEFDVKTKDGRRVNIDVNAQLLYAGGQPVGVQGIARDVTERRRAEMTRMQHARDLAARVLEAQEEERKRIARELHDETAQSLSILLAGLDVLEPRIPTDDPVLRSGFERVYMLARRVLDGTRALSHNLRPSILDDVGLAAALQWLAGEYELSYGGHVDVAAPDLDGMLSPEEEVALFRIAQEALTNCGKHAHASEVHLSLSVSGSAAQLVVEDDGAGFNPVNVPAPSRQGRLGLYGMRERAGLLGGALEITTAPQSGTRIVATIPRTAARTSDLVAQNIAGRTA
ncbi:MAG TPA: PAS domain S-box protein [Chloroflexota bacterium]|nr:PAS domain S-box protein [Chloroflexota bacterium]